MKYSLKNLAFILCTVVALFAVSCQSDGNAEEADGTRADIEQVNQEDPGQDNPATPVSNTTNNTDPSTPAGPTTSITFAENSYDFGTIV